MPNTGCFKFIITSSKFFSFKYFIAELASPTPGKITLSDDFKILILSVTTALIPIRSRANKTDCTFPALYFIIDTFIFVFCFVMASREAILNISGDYSVVPTLNGVIYNTPLVLGKLILFASLFTASLMALAKALNIDSILWCSFVPSTLMFKLHFDASLNDLKK